MEPSFSVIVKLFLFRRWYKIHALHFKRESCGRFALSSQYLLGFPDDKKASAIRTALSSEVASSHREEDLGLQFRAFIADTSKTILEEFHSYISLNTVLHYIRGQSGHSALTGGIRDILANGRGPCLCDIKQF